LLLAAYPVYATSSYTPRAGDYFNYHEVVTLNNGKGSYAGYTEQTVTDGKETMDSVDSSGTVSASYSYTYSFSNSSGSTQTSSKSGDYSFSSTSYLYVNGTDDQTGYVNPTVWFLMDNSIPQGGTFTVLNTVMNVQSTGFGYYLASQSQNIKTIYTEGTSSYDRNDEYGQFTATYTWKIYFDPATGYIVGYQYVEQDTDPQGNGFTWTDNLYVTTTSYQLTAAPSGVPSGESQLTTQDAEIIVAVVVVIVIVLVVVFALSRRKALPKHSPQQERYAPEAPTPPPQNIDLTPKEQPPVQQIVIKEVVKVKCRFCGALIDSTAQTCPICGAPRT